MKRCPVCKEPLDLYAGFTTGNYQCRKCGYIGPLALEEEKDEKKKSLK